MIDIVKQKESQLNWFSLGYSCIPFSTKTGDNPLFYKFQSLINVLNRLCTLDTSSHSITVLCGESGCGKSTCLRVLSKMRSNYHVALVGATSGLSPQNLTKVLFHNISQPTLALSSAPSIDICTALLKHLKQRKRKIRILIDEASRLPEATRSFIQTISQIQPNGTQVQFVLCVSSPEQLSELHESKAFSPQVVQLGSLSRDETQRFVNLKLQNGHSSKQALTAPERYLDLLFERSGGNIKRILTDAADTLPRFLGERAPPATSNTSHANSISILPVLGIALILVITSYFIITKSPLTAVTAPEQLAPSYVQSSGIYFPSAAMISDVLFLLTQG